MDIHPFCKFCTRFQDTCKGEDYLPEYCMSDALVVLFLHKPFGRFVKEEIKNRLKEAQFWLCSSFCCGDNEKDSVVKSEKKIGVFAAAQKFRAIGNYVKNVKRERRTKKNELSSL